MGNSQSSDESKPKSPNNNPHQGTATSNLPSPYGDDRVSPQRNQTQPRRLQAQAGRGINPLTQSLVSTGGSASTSTSSAHAHATVSASPQRSGHIRARSMTASAAITEPVPFNNRSDLVGSSIAEVKPPQSYKPASISSTTPSKPAALPSTKAVQSPMSQPMDVPLPANHDNHGDAERDSLVAGYSESPYGLPQANYSRPPRLPLPIEEEVHTPGSPIIDAQDLISPLDASEVEGALPRKNSVLSSTTIDEDEYIIDNETFAAESSRSMQLRISTLVEWNGEGEKIFVTGTFCNWEKKMKLHRNRDKPGFSAHILLLPGTHHLKFLVDGEMMTSNDLPTTVDWTNILVNYIEIVAPLPAAPTEPMPIPGRLPSDSGLDEPATRPSSYRTGVREAEADIPPTPELIDGLDADQVPTQQPSPYSGPVTPTPLQQGPHETAPLKHKILPRPRYTNQIPEFLLDLDNYNNPDEERYQNALKAASYLPQPPSLPSFMGKSILNSSTPHKDDASVLVLPNHTVINHLATSSIKSGVLATSATTRHLQKASNTTCFQPRKHADHFQFLTTIMYRPTSDSG